MEEFDRRKAFEHLMVAFGALLLPFILLTYTKTFENNQIHWIERSPSYEQYHQLLYSLNALVIISAFLIPIVYLIIKNIKRLNKAIKNKKIWYSIITTFTVIVLVFSLYVDIKTIAKHYSYIVSRNYTSIVTKSSISDD